MDTAWIIAVAGLVTGVGGLIVSWRTARASARKDEVQALREIIEALRERIKELEAQVSAWQRRFTRLCIKYHLNPDEEITGPLGGLPDGGS
jgi:type VI protein secretion system component VasK